MTDLLARLQALGSMALADSWQDVMALVTSKRWSFQAIEHVVALEEKERAPRGQSLSATNPRR